MLKKMKNLILFIFYFGLGAKAPAYDSDSVAMTPTVFDSSTTPPNKESWQQKWSHLPISLCSVWCSWAGDTEFWQCPSSMKRGHGWDTKETRIKTFFGDTTSIPGGFRSRLVSASIWAGQIGYILAHQDDSLVRNVSFSIPCWVS